MRILFDTRELYFLTQYMPVYRTLVRRGVDCGFVAYHNRPTELERMKRAFLGLPVQWVQEKEDGLELYRRERPAWILFGNSYALKSRLPEGTRTAMLYHGIGMKSDVYSPGISAMDVRFMEGPHYVRNVLARSPQANLQPVGYAKLDPFFGPEDERPTFDVEAAGLDRDKRTLVYAPTAAPSSFPNMSDRLPEHFPDFNLIVKPHYLSYFSSSRKSHRRKMALWREAPNCYVAGIDEWDPLPFMSVADLLISDVSAIVFEFAALDRPVIWCDFMRVNIFRRGPFRYRLRRRMCEVLTEFADVAAHAPRYNDLRRTVDEELADPQRLAAQRRRATRELIGPTDGHVADRIADYLMGAQQDEEGAPLVSDAPEHAGRGDGRDSRIGSTSPGRSRG